jgi:hypothetical protein
MRGQEERREFRVGNIAEILPRQAPTREMAKYLVAPASRRRFRVVRHRKNRRRDAGATLHPNSPCASFLASPGMMMLFFGY